MVSRGGYSNRHILNVTLEPYKVKRIIVLRIDFLCGSKCRIFEEAKLDEEIWFAYGDCFIGPCFM